MHALNHIIDGTLCEKIFWSCSVVVMVAVAGYLTTSLFVSYSTHRVTTAVKVVSKTSMKLPSVFLCDNRLINISMSRANCDNNNSKSYDPVICRNAAHACPEFYKECVPGAGEDCPGYKTTCLFYGGCILINGDGDYNQTLVSHNIKYTFNVKPSDIPIWLHVTYLQPGDRSVLSHPRAHTKWFALTQPGNRPSFEPSLQGFFQTAGEFCWYQKGFSCFKFHGPNRTGRWSDWLEKVFYWYNPICTGVKFCSYTRGGGADSAPPAGNCTRWSISTKTGHDN